MYWIFFLQLTAVLDTAVLSREQRLYLPLYIELLFESPILRNGGTSFIMILYPIINELDHENFIHENAILSGILILNLFLSLSLPLPRPELIPHETVVKELVADTVSYSAELGAGGERFSAGSFAQAIFIAVKVQEKSTSHFCKRDFCQDGKGHSIFSTFF